MELLQSDNYHSFIGLGQVSDEICDTLIESFEQEEAKDYGKAGYSQNFEIKKSIDISYHPAQFPNYINELLPLVTKYIELHTPHLTEGLNRYGFVESFNVQKYNPGDGFYAWHCERTDAFLTNRVLVWMTYLNDVPNGGTEWYFQGIKTEAKKGSTVIWPVDFTHTHRGIVSNTHTKYIATGWLGWMPENA